MVSERYTLEREIGRGGMGAVWLGRDEVLGRRVAVKRVGVAPGASSPDLLRAEREARIAASLNHPNIVGVFDLIDDGDQQYLVMEYVEGLTLAQLIRERGPLSHAETARILAQVAAGLAAAHAKHVVHRDVKPSNILVSDDGHVKLSDFGIARNEADSSLTQTGLVTGSPSYLSPEVAQGKQATTASDVWSLGATLFHALAGRPPYEVTDSVLGALYQIVNEPPPRLPDAAELAPVLLATMAHDPRRRWSMDDVARVLEMVATAGPTDRREPAAAPVDEPVLPVPEPEPVPEPLTRSLPVVASTPPPPRPEPPAPARSPAPPGPRRRGVGVLPVLVAVLVVALVVLIGVLLLQDDPQDTSATDPGGTPSSTTPSRPDSSPPTSEPPTTEPPTSEQLEDFVVGYVETASSDPGAGFELLTPEYQAQSPDYDQFWGRVSNPQVLSFDADVDDLVVTYTYRYEFRGEGRKTERVSLRLVDDDGGGFLIAGLA